MDHHVKDLSLSKKGKSRIEWAERDMPVLRHIKENFASDIPPKTEKLEGARQIPEDVIKALEKFELLG